jgi:uncharacterized protein (TIGR03437 family)
MNHRIGAAIAANRVGYESASQFGLVQVNAQVPLDAPAGDSVPLFLTVVGDNPPQDFQSGVTIAIR